MSLNKWHNQPLDGILLNEKNDMMNLLTLEKLTKVELGEVRGEA
jgi:hypothetical protein